MTGNRAGVDGVRRGVQPLPPLTADAVALAVPSRPATSPAARDREIVLPEGARVRASALSGHRPDHLALAPRPAPLPEDLVLADHRSEATGLRRATVRQGPDAGPGTTSRPAPAEAAVFADTRYPWSTTGRVDVAGGWGSGVLVGPRHVLTAAHIIPWLTGDGGAASTGWVRFVPAAFDASEPFGSASAVAVYCLQATYPPSIDHLEERVDFAVCVLDLPIGDLTGWMGVHAYRDEWDHLPRWSHVGYRGTHATGTRPTHQSGLALDGRPHQADTHQAMVHRGDVNPGQSGGPLFGWWPGEAFPRVVAVQSWGWPGHAGASGGDHLVDLVVRARQEHP